MTLDSSYIARTLSWTDEDLKRHIIEDTKIPEFHQPVIILGDPGMGKTILMERLGEQPECGSSAPQAFCVNRISR